MVKYPNLEAEMVRRDVSREIIAETIEVQDRTIRNKLAGRTPFTWPEVKAIRTRFFPDIPMDVLFATPEELNSA